MGLSASGQNFAPPFLRLNAKATVPTLVVPLEKTLARDVESRYRAITNPEAILEFLDKCRSVYSRTRTTSSAPAPTLSPATVAFATTSKKIVEEIGCLQEEKLRYMNAWDVEMLRAISKDLLPHLSGQSDALGTYIAEGEGVEDRTLMLWGSQKRMLDSLIDVMKDAGIDDEELGEEGMRRREGYFEEAGRVWKVELKNALVKVNDEISGPFLLGDYMCLADVHVAAWLVCVVELSGGEAGWEGRVALRGVGERIGWERRDKVVEFWDCMRERDSWRRVYL